MACASDCYLQRRVSILRGERNSAIGVDAMKAVLRYVLALLSLVPVLFLPQTTTVAQTQAQVARPWQQVTVPSTSEVAASFKAPPREYGAIAAFTSWNGTGPAEVRRRIVADLDRMSANGMFIINLSPGRRDMAHGEPAYLSPGHMDQVKFTVAELAKRNMRMWIPGRERLPERVRGRQYHGTLPAARNASDRRGHHRSMFHLARRLNCRYPRPPWRSGPRKLTRPELSSR